MVIQDKQILTLGMLGKKSFALCLHLSFLIHILHGIKNFVKITGKQLLITMKAITILY